jgi:phenylacetate-CoA ligase
MLGLETPTSSLCGNNASVTQELMKRYLGRAVAFNNPVAKAIERKLAAQYAWTAGDLESYRCEQLCTTLRVAANRLPMYAALRGQTIDSSNCFDVLRSLPIVSREELFERREMMYPNRGRPLPWYSIGRTSGTTGSPLTIFRSPMSVLVEDAFLRRYWQLAGFNRGEPRATLRGDLVVPVDRTEPPFWYFNRFDNQLLLSSRHIGQYGMAIAEKIAQFAPRMLQAYPSTAYALAKTLEEQDQHLDIPIIMTSSEPLYPHQRSLIQNRLRGRIWDMYGMAERVALATECAHGTLHVNADYSHVEIVDADGSPTDDHGFIVGTTFHNNVMPLVRYRLSDHARWRQVPCACGCAFPAIEPVTGKYEDQITGRKGNFISPSVVTFAFKGLRCIRQSQIVQHKPGKWTIRIVPKPGYQPSDSAQIVRNIATLVDSSIEARVEIVNDISMTQAGKYRWIVNEEMTPAA